LKLFPAEVTSSTNASSSAATSSKCAKSGSTQEAPRTVTSWPSPRTTCSGTTSCFKIALFQHPPFNSRLYSIENGTALSHSTYQMGETPVGVFPGTRTSYLAAFGEVGVDFDFGQPELDLDTGSLFIKETNFSTLLWPVYVLRGDGSVYSVNVPLDKKYQRHLSFVFLWNLVPPLQNKSDREGAHPQEYFARRCQGGSVRDHLRQH
jgi:hypothetical protein